MRASHRVLRSFILAHLPIANGVPKVPQHAAQRVVLLRVGQHLFLLIPWRWHSGLGRKGTALASLWPHLCLNKD